MATCTATSAWVAATRLPHLAPKASSSCVQRASQTSFHGLRASSRLHSLSLPSSHASSFSAQTSLAIASSRTRCGLNPALIISLSNGALLFLGRFVFLPFQRSQVAKAGLPTQNGVSHFEAGDSRAAEVSSLLKTGDPAGFTIIDLLAWGSLGHAVAFFILATASNGYDPQF